MILESTRERSNARLIDLRANIISELRQSATYNFRSSLNHFRLVVGKADFISKHTPLPVQSELLQNFPNPFNASTFIRYALSKPDYVTLIIYNLKGEKIIALTEHTYQQTGVNEIRWNGQKAQGDFVASGVYLYRLRTEGGFTVMKKLVYLK